MRKREGERDRERERENLKQVPGSRCQHREPDAGLEHNELRDHDLS